MGCTFGAALVLALSLMSQAAGGRAWRRVVGEGRVFCGLTEKEQFGPLSRDDDGYANFVVGRDLCGEDHPYHSTWTRRSTLLLAISITM